MRSPRTMRVEKSRTTGRPPYALVRSLASKTMWPERSAASTCSRTLPVDGATGGAFLAHRHQRADAPFVAGAPRLDAATQPRFFLRQALVEFLRGQRFAREPRVLLLEKGRVVARPRRQSSAVELDDARRETFEKRAIVRDEDDRAGVGREKRLEPFDRLDVEMVGRLVEQEQIGFRHERAGQQHAPAPAAGQRVERHVGVERQTGQHELDALLDAPAVALLELVLQTARGVAARRRSPARRRRRRRGDSR